jgi:hypothetical protein
VPHRGPRIRWRRWLAGVRAWCLEVATQRSAALACCKIAPAVARQGLTEPSRRLSVSYGPRISQTASGLGRFPFNHPSDVGRVKSRGPSSGSPARFVIA